jgi:putative tryptophan/tyrosine transport system substrate-binding protein
VKYVGVLFDSSQDSDFPAKAERAARQAGLRVYAYPIEKEKEVGRAMQLLKESGAEVFLMTYDPLIMNPEIFRYLVDFSVNNRMALFVPSNALLKSGGVMSFEADYPDLGRQAGALVNSALKKSGGPMGVELLAPRKGVLGLNLKVADIVGVSIARDVIRKADNVYE